MFRLPGGGWRSPDAAWVGRERWNALARPQQIGFPPIAPDFVIEIQSPGDRRSDLLTKMDEYTPRWHKNPVVTCEKPRKTPVGMR
jgi:Uma2 family endonuclease